MTQYYCNILHQEALLNLILHQMNVRIIKVIILFETLQWPMVPYFIFADCTSYTNTLLWYELKSGHIDYYYINACLK